jgi:hypothetical protein
VRASAWRGQRERARGRRGRRAAAACSSGLRLAGASAGTRQRGLAAPGRGRQEWTQAALARLGQVLGDGRSWASASARRRAARAQRRSASGRCWRRALGRATRRSRCGAGSDAGEPEAERRQSRTRERLRRELCGATQASWRQVSTGAGARHSGSSASVREWRG